jgi:hypothetical protein
VLIRKERNVKPQQVKERFYGRKNYLILKRVRERKRDWFGYFFRLIDTEAY